MLSLDLEHLQVTMPARIESLKVNLKGNHWPEVGNLFQA